MAYCHTFLIMFSDNNILYATHLFSFQKIFDITVSKLLTQELVAKINCVLSIFESVNIKYCSSVISKNYPIADDLTELIDHNPFISSILLKMEISIWTNAI